MVHMDCYFWRTVIVQEASHSFRIEKTNELINAAHEEIREFDSSADNKLAKNSEKYRDLMVKEREYDEFLNGFEEQRQKLEAELEGYSDQVVEILQKISINIDELTVLGEQEIRYKAEMEGMDKKMKELGEQRKTYSDLEQLAVDVERNMKHRLKELTEQLESNPEYAEVKSLQRELEMVDEKRARLQTEAEAIEKETNYESIKAEVRRLRALYNEQLVAALGARR
ncbi:unnamed protein product [Heligmosomoides polygyrus]|uniref:IF rod domain-containing protein n=1 Tax=Heligmosomoides polygyrus TaxID=6339 RepID=A0A183G9V1_HELPZ|nr:unnamed protein product [Heligmosomoides polygyrus]